jgi:hypothetical protein
MYSYMSQFFGGVLDPTWPHAVLIAGSIIGGALVGLGVILEAPKILSIPVAAVVIGVIIEAACTLLLFGFDEGISSRQQASIVGQQISILVQQDGIIALTKLNAELSEKEQATEIAATKAKGDAAQAVERAAQLERTQRSPAPPLPRRA